MRSPKTTRLLAAAVSVLLVGTACAAPAASPEAAARWRPPADGLRWGPCADDATQDCAVLRVPIDWANPGGAQVDLNVRRIRAADPAKRIGVLVLKGGLPLTEPTRRLREHFDFVSYRAKPEKTCWIRGPLVPQFPASQAEFEVVRAGMRTWYEQCARQTGIGFQHDNSAAQARDVDAIRAAMGEDTISFMHTWENEIVGQLYAELFPHRVRAMVLDGNLDHSVRTAEEYMSTKAGSVESTFVGFARWCDLSPACELHGRDVSGIYHELRARTERGEVGPFTPIDLSAYVGAAGDYPDASFGRLSESFRHLYEESSPATAAPRLGPARPAAPAATAGEPLVYPTGVGRGLSFGHFCQDWNLPIRDYAELQRIVAAQAVKAPHVRINQNQYLNVVGCAGWPFAVGNPTHRLRITTPLPVLVVHGRYAPGQPVEWAESVAEQIPGSTRLLYEGPGTLAYRESDCVRTSVDDFLISLRRPARDTCPPVWPTR
ncbi:alpha/beta hydrolase [Micromonospora olivasterospora]|uniref:TAP-like protein n=1 Tax=Micromonospora olivasterospora TaxID=1880 RepID=A0A562I350_MICOL|nr:alpha/beta hydrolase [Micromonospora olivasterospora]TWH65128.1 TAP-like protein [Micromonospora olivasterospora]